MKLRMTSRNISYPSRNTKRFQTHLKVQSRKHLSTQTTRKSTLCLTTTTMAPLAPRCAKNQFLRPLERSALNEVLWLQSTLNPATWVWMQKYSAKSCSGGSSPCRLPWVLRKSSRSLSCWTDCQFLLFGFFRLQLRLKSNYLKFIIIK